MTTQCATASIEFDRLFNRQVSARFDGGRLTSDAGGLLLRETEHKLSVFERLAGCFTDSPRSGEFQPLLLGILRPLPTLASFLLLST